MKTTLFIGAGASKSFGHPTTKEFMDIANKANLPIPYTEVRQYVASQTGDENVDIEKILGELLDFYKFYQSLDEKESYKKWLLLKTNHVGSNEVLMKRTDDVR